MTRVPILATLVVLAAVATMIALGIWQLGRASEKDALLARYEAAAGLPPIDFPLRAMAREAMPLFRQSRATCLEAVDVKTVAGRNRESRSGYAHWVDCRTTGAEGPGLRIDIGWSDRPQQIDWRGGTVRGTIAPDTEWGMRLISAEGLSGLEPSAPPNVADIPNNHRSYAFQWFAFALSALVIYALALKGRGRARP